MNISDNIILFQQDSPFLPRHVDADRVKRRFHVGFYYRGEVTKDKSQRRASYCYVPETKIQFRWDK